MHKSNIITYESLCDSYNPKLYMSSRLMTTYEKTNIIGARIEQLAFGSASMLDEKTNNRLQDIKLIAREELRQNKIPLLISRTMPNGTKEVWKTDDMIIID